MWDLNIIINLTCIIINLTCIIIQLLHICLITLPSKWISTNFPKRLLLLFLTVLAFPNASNNGFAEGDKQTYYLIISIWCQKEFQHAQSYMYMYTYKLQ